MGTKAALKKTYKLIIKSRLAKQIGVHYQSIDRWLAEDAMPCSEYNGKTDYSRQIEEITQGQVTVEDLLGGWRPPHQKKVDS